MITLLVHTLADFAGQTPDGHDMWCPYNRFPSRHL
jgi:hypothetical protein